MTANNPALPESEEEKRRITALKKNRMNEAYYTKLEQILAERTQRPTVEDAIEVMRDLNNADYVDGFDLYRSNPEEPKRFVKGTTPHEIAHLCAKLGHTPFQENMQLAFEIGFDEGANLRDYPPFMLAKFHAMYDDEKKNYDKKALHYQSTAAPALSKRDTAIYFAAGMYLRNKWEAYCDAAMETKYDREKGEAKYEEQKQFCEEYGKHDSETLPQQKYLVWGDIETAPYALLKFSKDEWRAIEGVALGMYEPEQTHFPMRLRPIKDALVHAGLFFDRPTFVEKLTGKTTKNTEAFLERTLERRNNNGDKIER